MTGRKADCRAANLKYCPILLALTVTVWAAPPDPPQSPPARDLTEATIEELLQIEVTSVAKKEQMLSEVPARIQWPLREQAARAGWPMCLHHDGKVTWTF